MACCKCEEYRWPEPQPVVYRDDEGIAFCLFHAPVEHKGLSVADFNRQALGLVTQALERWRSGDTEACAELSGTIFSGKISFRGLSEGNKLPKILFYKSRFMDVDFSDCVFNDTVNFTKSNFDGITKFNMTTFSGIASFQNATFKLEADFSSATFLNVAFFDSARFNYIAFFQKAKFNSYAFFSDVDFVGDTGFWETALEGEAFFERSRFHAEADFSDAKFGSTTLFTETNFDQIAEYDNAVFRSAVDFVAVKFNNGALFSNARFEDKAKFLRSTFDGEVSFKDAQADENSLRLHSLSKSSLSMLLFTSMETSSLSFKDCVDWPEKLRLETCPPQDREKGEEARHKYKACEELCRSLKQKAAAEHDQPLVSRWHYREKLMHLRGLVTGERPAQLFDKVENGQYCLWYKITSSFLLVLSAPKLLISLDFWYWATSGFGERERRAGMWLAILICLPLILNAIPQPIESFPFSDLIDRTLDHIPFTKDLSAKGGWLRLGQGVSQFLIALQTTIFAFALRNRFRR